MADLHIIADLGYRGVDGVDLVPIRRVPGHGLLEHQVSSNKELSDIRVAVERAVAHSKC